MCLITAAPFRAHPKFIRSNLHLWHVDLPTGRFGHFFTFAITSPSPRPAVPPGVANPFVVSSEPLLIRTWQNVTEKFMGRARRYDDRRRLCPLCSLGAERRCEPRYTDLP